MLLAQQAPLRARCHFRAASVRSQPARSSPAVPSLIPSSHSLRAPSPEPGMERWMRCPRHLPCGISEPSITQIPARLHWVDHWDLCFVLTKCENFHWNYH